MWMDLGFYYSCFPPSLETSTENHHFKKKDVSCFVSFYPTENSLGEKIASFLNVISHKMEEVQADICASVLLTMGRGDRMCE